MFSCVRAVLRHVLRAVFRGSNVLSVYCVRAVLRGSNVLSVYVLRAVLRGSNVLSVYVLELLSIVMLSTVL